jgi:hypothetical protein
VKAKLQITPKEWALGESNYASLSTLRYYLIQVEKRAKFDSPKSIHCADVQWSKIQFPDGAGSISLVLDRRCGVIDAENADEASVGSPTLAHPFR